MKQMKSCGASGFSRCDWNSFAICQLFQKKKKKDQHFDHNEYKMASIKSKTDYFFGFTGCVSHLTVLEGYYDLSLKPHSGVPFMARWASALKKTLCLKVIFINLHRFPKFGWLRQRFSDCCLVAGHVG